MAAPEDGPFWTFSLALYGRPGVSAALIGLQDRLGLDVNMLLFCCWTGSGGRSLSTDDLSAVEAATEPWQTEVVRPLRALRRRLKTGIDGLPADRVEAYRKRIADLEIEGERIAQDAMANRLPGARQDHESAAARVAANLTTYLRLRNAAAGGDDRAALTTVLRACCPEAGSGPFTFESA